MDWQSEVVLWLVGILKGIAILSKDEDSEQKQNSLVK